MTSLRKGLTCYLLIEIIMLTGLCFLISNTNNKSDFVFKLLIITMVFSVIAGIFFIVACIISRIRNVIDGDLYGKYFLLSTSGVIIPVAFLFLLLSRLH